MGIYENQQLVHVFWTLRQTFECLAEIRWNQCIQLLAPLNMRAKKTYQQILNRSLALHGFGYRHPAIEVSSARIEDGASYFPAVWIGAGLLVLVETKDFLGEFLAGRDF